MKQKELVSIVVPVYQAERYLERGILSVLAQTYRPIEILLIDDGSLDKSPEICDAYAEKYPEISVYHRVHKGVSAARNYGISQAKGTYIQFMDADDEMLPRMIEYLVQSIEEENTYMAVCGYEVVDKNVYRQENFGGRNRWNGCSSMNHAYEIVQRDLLSVTWNKLYIRARIRDLYDESMVICEDSVFCIRYFMRNPKVAVCSKILYRYHSNNNDLRKYRIFRYKDIEKLFYDNCRLVRHISDKQKRRMARRHIAEVFFYGVYTYIFEVLPYADLSVKEKRAVLRDIIHDNMYHRILSKLRRLHFKEECYRAASMLHSDRMLYAMIIGRSWLINKGKKYV